MENNVRFRLIGICENGEETCVYVPNVKAFVMGNKDEVIKDEALLEEVRHELFEFYGKFGWDLDGDSIYCYGLKTTDEAK